MCAKDERQRARAPREAVHGGVPPAVALPHAQEEVGAAARADAAVLVNDPQPPVGDLVRVAVLVAAVRPRIRPARHEVHGNALLEAGPVAPRVARVPPDLPRRRVRAEHLKSHNLI